MALLPASSGSSKTQTISTDSQDRTATSDERCTPEATAGRCRSHLDGYETTTSQSDREDCPSLKKKKKPKFNYTWLRLRNEPGAPNYEIRVRSME